jgi:hypothetical protein
MPEKNFFESVDMMSSLYGDAVVYWCENTRSFNCMQDTHYSQLSLSSL